MNALYTPATLDFDDTRLATSYLTDTDLQKRRLLFSTIQIPLAVRLGPALANLALSWNLPVEWAIRDFFFSAFCGGTTLPEAMKTATKLYAQGVRATLDYAVEGEKTEAGFEDVLRKTIDTLRSAAADPAAHSVAVKLTGLGPFAAMEAVQAGNATTTQRKQVEDMNRRLMVLCQEAARLNQPILLDAEESWIQDVIDRAAETAMLACNTQAPIVYTTVQLYRHDRLAYLHGLYERMHAAGAITAVKLVRGAYLEKENARAADRNYPTPMQPGKRATDTDYDAAVLYILERLADASLVAGTHNEDSCRTVVGNMAALGIAAGSDRVWFSQLYGMSDNISFVMAKSGYNVTKYLPFGPVRHVMPYLFRRAQENSAIASQGTRELTIIAQEQKRRRRQRNMI